MKGLFVFLLILLIGIPLFAVFQLLHRLEQNPVNRESGEEFYRALRLQYGLDKEEAEQPKRTLTRQERIELAKRISEDPFADVKAEDVMSELSEETPAEVTAVPSSAEGAEKKSVPVSDVRASDNTPSEGRMTKEQAMALVSGMLGSDKKKKGSAYASLQETLAKYQNQDNNKK